MFRRRRGGLVRSGERRTEKMSLSGVCEGFINAVVARSPRRPSRPGHRQERP